MFKLKSTPKDFRIDGNLTQHLELMKSTMLFFYGK